MRAPTVIAARPVQGLILGALVLVSCNQPPPTATVASPTQLATVTLPTGTGSIAGSVTRLNGEPLSGAFVSLDTIDAVVTSSASNGSFSILGLEVRPYKVLARHLRAGPNGQLVRVFAGQTASAELQLADLGQSTAAASFSYGGPPPQAAVPAPPRTSTPLLVATLGPVTATPANPAAAKSQPSAHCEVVLDDQLIESLNEFSAVAQVSPGSHILERRCLGAQPEYANVHVPPVTSVRISVEFTELAPAPSPRPSVASPQPASPVPLTSVLSPTPTRTRTPSPMPKPASSPTFR
jgi:hypothetical protein